MKKEEKEKYTALLNSTDPANWKLAIQLLKSQQQLANEDTLKWVLEALIANQAVHSSKEKGIDFGSFLLSFDLSYDSEPLVIRYMADTWGYYSHYRILIDKKEIFKAKGICRGTVFDADANFEEFKKALLSDLPLIIPELLKQLT